MDTRWHKVANAADDRAALREIADADAFFGKLTPPLLAAARRLRWVQSPTVSLEHFVFPELVAHPCTLTNMRGIFSDVIADHVFGFILCFARNLHRYIRQQAAHRWAPVGGEAARSTFAAGPGTVSAIDRAHLHLADQTLGVVGESGAGKSITGLAIIGLLEPPGRIAAMGQRLKAALQALDVVQPALDRFYGSLSDEQKARLIEIANKCPVHRTLTSEIVIETSLVPR